MDMGMAWYMGLTLGLTTHAVACVCRDGRRVVQFDLQARSPESDGAFPARRRRPLLWRRFALGRPCRLLEWHVERVSPWLGLRLMPHAPAWLAAPGCFFGLAASGSATPGRRASLHCFQSGYSNTAGWNLSIRGHAQVAASSLHT